MNEDRCSPHYVEWTEDKIERYWAVYQTHPGLFRSLIFLPGTNKNPMLDYVVNQCRGLVPRGAKILDVGFGNGYVIKKMALLGYRCFGIDISETNVDLTMQEISKNRRLNEADVELKVGSISQLSSAFGNNVFDLIIVTEVLEHLKEETLHKALLEIGRCLKLGGYLFVTTPYNEVLERSLVLCPDCHAIFHAVGHFQTFDKKRMECLLRRHNFRVVRCSTIDSRLPTVYHLMARCKLLRSMVARQDSSLAYTQNLYAVAQKEWKK